MQCTKRFCRTNRKKMSEDTKKMIRKLGQYQLENLEQEKGIKLTPDDVYNNFSIDFVFNKICPILKNLNDRSLISSIIEKTREQITQTNNIDDINTYNKIIEYLS